MYTNVRHPTRLSIFVNGDPDDLWQMALSYASSLYPPQSQDMYVYQQFDRYWKGYYQQKCILMDDFEPIVSSSSLTVAYSSTYLSEKAKSLLLFYKGLWNSRRFELKVLRYRLQNNSSYITESIPFHGEHFFITSQYQPYQWFGLKDNSELHSLFHETLISIYSYRPSTLIVMAKPIRETKKDKDKDTTIQSPSPLTLPPQPRWFTPTVVLPQTQIRLPIPLVERSLSDSPSSSSASSSSSCRVACFAPSPQLRAAFQSPQPEQEPS